MVKLLQAPLGGLPEGLASRPGLAEDSLSEFGPAGQALTAEARLLAQPVSFELLVACQAIDLRESRLGAGTQRAFELVRARLPFKREDDPIPASLEPLRELVRSGELGALGG